MRTKILAILVSSAVSASSLAQTVFVEAEQFTDLGGWVADSQFMDQMGSPFLLAHGLGRPVEDAKTQLGLPTSGTYQVWVRTRDWVATWDAPGAPGRFRLLINGRPLDTTFGSRGAEWHWQRGGRLNLAQGQISLALHDLTGFEGRCDAIVLSADPDFLPPNREPELSTFRREILGLPEKPVDGGRYDLVVTGGGIAGTCASLAAARLGLKVALIQDRPVLGGNNSSEVRVWLQGARNQAPYPRVGDIVRELEQRRKAHYGPSNTADLYEDDRKLALVRAEKNLSLFLQHRVNTVETAGQRIHAVVAQDTVSGLRKRLAGRWFLDSTGDGCVGHLAGADYELTATGHMGRCNLWNVIDTGQSQPFPRCPWALDLSDKPFPGRDRSFGVTRQHHRGIEALGGWYWESGFDHDPFEKSEYVRDWNFRAMYGAWDALKNVDRRYPNHRLNWAAHISGKRESRRLLGDVILSKEDVLGAKEYPDGCVPTGWPIDLHLPHPDYERGFEGDAFVAQAHYDRFKHTFWVPYRCLYSRNIDNLFMAGRDISVTHEALGTVRVMRTGGCMGEIVGMAAAICRTHGVDPRAVYEHHLSDLKRLMTQGVGKPPAYSFGLQPPKWLKAAGPNLAPKASVRASGVLMPGRNLPERVNDGQVDLLENDGRWLSNQGAPNWIELTWDQPQTISAARVISGYRGATDEVSEPIASFVLQARNGNAWREIGETVTEANQAIDWHRQFKPVTTKHLRLFVSRTHGGVSRVWEIEVYGPTP